MDLATVIVSSAIGIGTAVVTLIAGSHLGLGPIQQALVNGLRERVTFLEKENAELKARVAEQDATVRHLKIDNEQLTSRVANLERLIVDKALTT